MIEHIIYLGAAIGCGCHLSGVCILVPVGRAWVFFTVASLFIFMGICGLVFGFGLERIFPNTPPNNQTGCKLPAPVSQD
jgi:hypothetical protein